MLDSTWVTEQHVDDGSAFSMKLGRKLHDEQSAFQHVEIYETETFGNLMLLDGFVMLTTRDNFLYHEMMTHPALLLHPDPKNVVIIGGGDCGSLQQVLRHKNVQTAHQIDIDERVTRLSEEYFPELCANNNDPRAQLSFIDGIKWMAEQPAQSADIIIIDSTDPVGPGEGLFSHAFYADCYRVLGEGGILVQQSESPLYHLELLKKIHSCMQQAGFTTRKTLHFPQPVYPSGWWSATLAGKNTALDQVREGANELGDMQYYSPQMQTAAFCLPPFVEKALAAV